MKDRCMAEGLTKGSEQAKQEIARKMYEYGITVEQILAITGLSPDITVKHPPKP